MDSQSITITEKQFQSYLTGLEKTRARGKRFYQAHKEAIIEKKLQYYEANKEILKQKRKERYQKKKANKIDPPPAENI